MNALDRTLHAIDATLTATTQEPTMTDQPQAARPDDGINLTKQALTDADRAALYPTVPADPPAVEVIDRHLMAASDYHAPPATRREDARALHAALTDHDHIPAPRTGLTTVEQLRRDLADMTEARDTVQQTLATATAERDTFREAAIDHRATAGVALSDLYAARRTIASQAEQIRRNCAYIGAVDDVMARFYRARAAHASTTTAPAQDAADGPEGADATSDVDGPATDAPRGAEDDLTDRLAAALTRLMRRNGGEGITPAAWQSWKALLVEHADRNNRAATLAQIADEAAQVQADIAAGRVADRLGDPPPAAPGDDHAKPCHDPVCRTLLPEQSCDTCGRYVDWPTAPVPAARAQEG